MQTTDKYKKIIEEAEKTEPANSTNTNQQKATTVRGILDREVIIAEINAIMADAYTAGEPSNSQQ